jgi:hypothetical protein
LQSQFKTQNNEKKTLSKTQQTLLEFKLIKSTLIQNHPELFKNKKSPLAHDIREQILDIYPDFNSDVVLRFLRYVFSTANYLEAISLNTDRCRYNLNLSPTSFISTEQRKTAANYLVAQLNNYKNEKGLKWFSNEQRHAFFNSLESLDHRFDTERYEIEHEEFNKFLLAQEKANQKDEVYNLSDNMWPDNG